MLFNFRLKPLQQVMPWGKPGSQRLHWFGLTDGEYWIQAGADTLLEYSNEADPHLPRYCDYHVVRLHEDLLEIVPKVLDPIPDDLQPYLSGDSGAAWQRRSQDWYEGERIEPDDSFWTTSDSVLELTGNRWLDTGYLRPCADILMWSDRHEVHIEWDNRDKLFEGAPAWSALRGHYRLGRTEFIAEVRGFHVRLMEQMAERIEQVAAGALPPSINIDLPGLRAEHVQRSRLGEASFAPRMPPTDWDTVREAIRVVESASDQRSAH